MKKLLLLLFVLMVAGCGGGSSPSVSVEPTTQADPIVNGAHNAYVDYTPVPSELQDLVNQRGHIKLPCGTYEGGIISIPNGTIVEGSGVCTKIPSVRAQGDTRAYNIQVKNLRIDGDIDGQGVIGVDFRNCSTCLVENVMITGIDYGVLLTGEAYSNRLINVNIRPNKTCYEIVYGANENIINGGQCQTANFQKEAVGVWLQEVNNVRITNVWFENMDVGFLLGSQALHTTILAPRCERMNTCVEMAYDSDRTLIINAYKSGVTAPIVSNGARYEEVGY